MYSPSENDDGFGVIEKYGYTPTETPMAFGA
jgi:hypothetical protein